MAQNYFSGILLYILLQAVSWHRAVNSSLEVAVEGNRVQLACTTDSSFGVDWRFNNGKREYRIYEEHVIPDQFKMNYSVTNVNHSLYATSHLSIARVKTSNVGTYTCLGGENRQHTLTSVDLALLTTPKCEPDTNSSETIRRYACNFTFVLGNLTNPEWIGNVCTNNASTACSNVSDGNIYCEFPINRTHRKLLPFATNLASQGIEVCETSCVNWNATSTDGFQTTNSGMSIQMSILLQCSVTPTSTIKDPNTNTTTPTSQDATGSQFYLYGSIAVCVTGVLLTLITIALFRRNTDTCSTKITEEKPRNGYNEEHRYSPGEQIRSSSTYHELEPVYDEIAELPENAVADNQLRNGSGPMDNAFVGNRTCDSNSSTRNAIGSPIHIESPKLLPMNTHEKAKAAISPEYADPRDFVSTLPYAEVYQKKPNA